MATYFLEVKMTIAVTRGQINILRLVAECSHSRTQMSFSCHFGPMVIFLHDTELAVNHEWYLSRTAEHTGLLHLLRQYHLVLRLTPEVTQKTSSLCGFMS